LRATLRLEDDDFDGAKQDANRALVGDASNAKALSVSAFLAAARHDWSAALDQSDRALRSDPTWLEAVCINGWASAQLGDLAAATRRLYELREAGSKNFADLLEPYVRQLQSSASASARRRSISNALDGVKTVKAIIDIARGAFGT
jgi:hypothetical protein